MNILVTGAGGFAGRNLIENLKNLRDGKDRTRPALAIGEIYACGRTSTPEELDAWCGKADFVFHFAGVNRPEVRSTPSFMAHSNMRGKLM